jgi:hypothetical protein
METTQKRPYKGAGSQGKKYMQEPSVSFLGSQEIRQEEEKFYITGAIRDSLFTYVLGLQ